MVMSLVCASGADDVGSSPPSPPVLQAARTIEPPASSARILAPLCVVLKVGFLLGWGQGARSGVYRCGRRPVPDRDGTRDLPRSGVTEHQWWQGSQGRPTACYRDETDRCPTGVRAILRRDLAVTGRPLAAARRAAAGILTSRHLPPPEGRVPHTWDPDRYLDLGRRARPSVPRPRGAGRRLLPRPRRRPRLRTGQPHRPAGAPVAGGAGARGRLEPRDGGAGRRRRLAGAVRGGRPARLGGLRGRRVGRRAGVERDAAVGAGAPGAAACARGTVRPVGGSGSRSPALR